MKQKAIFFNVSNENDLTPPIRDEIKKLHKMLTDAGIPHTFKTHPVDENGFQILYPFDSPKKSVCSVVELDWSYGGCEDLLEMHGLLTKEELEYDTVVGWLTAEEVFRRIQKHFMNTTKKEP